MKMNGGGGSAFHGRCLCHIHIHGLEGQLLGMTPHRDDRGRRMVVLIHTWGGVCLVGWNTLGSDLGYFTPGVPLRRSNFQVTWIPGLL